MRTQNNINFNAALNGSDTAKLGLAYGQGAYTAGNLSDYIVNVPVNLPAGPNFTTKLGSDGVTKNYDVITSLGVLADASGAHLFPTLLAVVLACRQSDQPVPAIWLAAVGLWAFGNGLRGILWHQLTDVEHDRQAGVRTFAVRHAPRRVAQWGAFVVFPIEVAALAVMLWHLPSALPTVALGVYAVLVALRLRRWDMRVVVVAPKPRFLIVLHEYYDAFLPIAVLLASAFRHPLDLVVLAVHLLLFSGRARQTWRDAVKLWHQRG